MWLFEFLKAAILKKNASCKRRKSSNRCIPLIKEFLAVMLRLKLGLYLQDIADRFAVSVATVSVIFNKWIFVMETELEKINPCPHRDVIKQTMPSKFEKFKNLRFIIDCTELFIQRPSSLTA